jgi:hypothetical protein
MVRQTLDLLFNYTILDVDTGNFDHHTRDVVAQRMLLAWQRSAANGHRFATQPGEAPDTIEHMRERLWQGEKSISSDKRSVEIESPDGAEKFYIRSIFPLF